MTKSQPLARGYKRKALLLAVCFTTLPFSYAAAQNPQTNPADSSPAPASPLHDWTGPYIGVQAGGGSGTSSQHYSKGRNTGNFGVRGGLAGLTLGYNQQYGPWVVGAEADFAGNWLNGNKTSRIGGYDIQLSTQVPWFATLRPRLGYAYGNLLPYITGGLALGNVRPFTYTEPNHIPITDSVETKLGWTAGTGLELALAPAWSIKAEYLYLNLDDRSLS